MMELLGVVVPPIDWAKYCQLIPAETTHMKRERNNDLHKSMLFLMNSKYNNAKKDLRLAYFQGNMTAYPPPIESMARYLSTEYPNKNSDNQHKGKQGIEMERKEIIRNLKKGQ